MPGGGRATTLVMGHVLIGQRSATRGRKRIFIMNITGNPAPKVLTNIARGMPRPYCFAERPRKSSSAPNTIGPKKSIAQYTTMIHISRFQCSEESSVVVLKELGPKCSQAIGTTV